MTPLFDKSGGYRKLHSFTFATVIHLGTIRFCKRFLNHQNDSLGKTAGQMIGAARSGRQNIIESSERSGTSKETEIQLTDVARASLAELLGDYEMLLAEKNVLPWPCQDENHQTLWQLRIPEFEFGNDPMHDYWRYFRSVQPLFSRWLENPDETVVANAMLILIARTTGMLDGQLRHQAKTFLENGGFKERMHQCRTETRDGDGDTAAPECPDCGKPMRQRTARTGKQVGQKFWGCSGYPDCKGRRDLMPE